MIADEILALTQTGALITFYPSHREDMVNITVMRGRETLQASIMLAQSRDDDDDLRLAEKIATLMRMLK